MCMLGKQCWSCSQKRDCRVYNSPRAIRIQAGIVSASLCVVGVPVRCRVDVQWPPGSLPNSPPPAVVKKICIFRHCSVPPRGQNYSRAPAKCSAGSQPLLHLGLYIPGCCEFVVKHIVSPPKGKRCPHPMVWVSLKSMASKRSQM